ncbi:MAG TPA: sensor histidine kinase [Candidatus Acidoferrales bacterium]|nr:sensor histidine kinase [Candidatus Acidoferrales bacterium]
MLDWIRFGFSVLTIIVAFLEPDKVVRFPLLYDISRYSFCLYSIAVLVLGYRAGNTNPVLLGIVTTCLDLFFVAVIDFSGSPGTPFFVYYLFPVITASSRYGLKGSLAAAAIGIAVYASIRFGFSSYWTKAFELDTFIVRCIYLFALAYMFGFLSDFEKQQNQKLMALNKTAGEAAMHEERRRLAQELHDGLLQVLATLALRLEVCRTHLMGKPAELVRELDLMEKAVKDAMVDIRHFLSGSGTRRLQPGTLAESLKREMGFLRDSLGLRCIFDTEPEELDLPPQTEREIYLVLREGLRNVARHAHASNARIALRVSPDEVRGTIADDGIGFHPEAKIGQGYGLASMKERIEKVGGKLAIESTPGKGTTVSFWVPLSRAAPRKAEPELNVSEA